MLVNVNDIVLSDELLEKHEKTLMVGPSIKTIKKSDKYFLIDWSNVDPSKIDLSTLKKNNVQIIMEEIDKIDNREFFGMVFKYLETPNEEFLWTRLVDWNLISDSAYQINTYEENLDILFKNRKTI